MLVTLVYVLILATSMAPIVQASGASLSVSPNTGQAGTTVNVSGGGFTGIVFISFNGTGIQSAFPSSTYGLMSITFKIPSVTPGTYDITAKDNQGNSAATVFTVTSSSASPSPTPTSSKASPKPTAASSSTSSTSTPVVTPHHTLYPIKTPAPQNNGFWSPLMIGVIVVIAFVVIVPVTFMYRSRSKHEILPEKEPLPYRSAPSPSTSNPAISSRYNQPGTSGQQPRTYGNQPSIYSNQTTRPVSANRYSQPSTYNQQPSSGKTCPHCKRVVKEDYNVCPYCYKRLK